MFEKAAQKRLDQLRQDIAIIVHERIVCLLLIELAWSRGLHAWLDREMAGVVWIRGTQNEVESILESAGPAAGLLKLRKLEALAEAVLLVGGRPSKELMGSIAAARRRAAECLFEMD